MDAGYTDEHSTKAPLKVSLWPKEQLQRWITSPCPDTKTALGLGLDSTFYLPSPDYNSLPLYHFDKLIFVFILPFYFFACVWIVSL